MVALAPRAWWAHKPRLPVPEPGYLHWRQATAYGSPDAPVIPADVIAYFEWRRRFRQATGRSGVASG